MVTEKYIHYLKVRRLIVFSLLFACFLIPSIHSDNQSKSFDQLKSFQVISKDLTTFDISNTVYYNYYTNAFSRYEQENSSELTTPPYFPQTEFSGETSMFDVDQELYTRIRVTDTTLPPYSFIGHVITTWDKNSDAIADGFEYCSGFMVGPNVMITAGHCVYDTWNGGWISSLSYFPEKNGRDDVLPPAEAISVSISQVFYLSESSDEDWALIKLDSPVGLDTGWFGNGWSSESMNGKQVAVTGYPTDKSYGELWSSQGEITSTFTSRVRYNMGTYSGQSGSPIYDSKGIVWGIHTRGSEYVQGRSSGTKITEELYNILYLEYLISVLESSK